MPLRPGVVLGSYEIQSPLGAGGMGEVYKATDTRLGRVVAIKVLPGDVAADPDLRGRFDREAKIVSSLNHRHICALYDVGRQDGIDFLVMEYLDGESLADRMARGRIPLSEALAMASQIAEALEAAHDKGVIHRDLKPSNVALTGDGTVKVLDFGLARLADSSVRPSASSFLTSIATTPGLILGTAAYMSPEQAKGKEADRGSDVWAFGCVLYEMLTGRRAFDGDTVSEILASVLKSEPAWQHLPPETTDGTRRLLRRTLQKDHRLRLRDIRDARLELADAQSAPPDNHAPLRSTRAERLAWATALAIVAVIAGVLGVQALSPAPVAPETILEISTPPTGNPSVAISPDGSKVVFVAGADGRSQLWLRSLDSRVARPLPGTERASRPFWSPDSRSIAFIAENRLKRMDIDGGSSRTLASGVAVALGGSWSADGTIVFGNNPGGPIFRVPAEGGDVLEATRVAVPEERGHMFPQFLSDSRHFLFFVSGSPEARGVHVGQLDESGAKRLFDADGPAVYVPTGHLLFIREGKLLSQGFDVDRLELTGDPFAITDQVNGGTTLSAATDGTIAYRTGLRGSGQRQLVWVDRSGRELDRVVYDDIAALGASLSHDGRRVAVYRLQNENMDVWFYDINRRAWDRITSHPGDDIYPTWSRDGASMVTGSVRTSTNVDLYRTFLGGAPQREELLLASSLPTFPMDWSPDGRFLLYDVLDLKRGFDVWVLPFDGDRRPFPLVETEFNEGLGQFSSDGQWIAYQSDRTGRPEIYLRPFPGPGADVRVSVDGGTQVRWSPNGSELYYVAADNQLMAVSVTFASGAGSAELGTPVALFATILSSTAGPMYKQQYMVSPDGQSFVMHAAVGTTDVSPITIIQNWEPKGAR
jgi:serine/threonine protein kinase